MDSGDDPPARLYERLGQLPGYVWDEQREPVHSSYDNWCVFADAEECGEWRR